MLTVAFRENHENTCVHPTVGGGRHPLHLRPGDGTQPEQNWLPVRPARRTRPTGTHCKKRFSIFPSPAGMRTKLSLGGYNLIFPAHGESLVSDIPAGDGKIVNLFLQCSNTMSMNIILHLMAKSYSVGWIWDVFLIWMHIVCPPPIHFLHYFDVNVLIFDKKISNCFQCFIEKNSVLKAYKWTLYSFNTGADGFSNIWLMFCCINFSVSKAFLSKLFRLKVPLS